MCRCPRPGRASDAALVEGEHGHAGTDQAVPKRVEVTAVAAVGRSGATDQHDARCRALPVRHPHRPTQPDVPNAKLHLAGVHTHITAHGYWVASPVAAALPRITTRMAVPKTPPTWRPLLTTALPVALSFAGRS